MATVRPCPRCPQTGKCDYCGFPAEVRDFIAKTGRCACGAGLEATANSFHPMLGTGWRVQCARRTLSTVLLGRGGEAGHVSEFIVLR